MVELAHVVKSCSDLTIYASDLSQPEKVMDSLKTNGLTVQQIYRYNTIRNVSARL